MHAFIDRLARVFALLGGIVLTLLIVLTCLSIAGRSINSIMFSDFFQTRMPGFAEFVLSTGVGPINGDFELVEAGMAFSIFAFLPLCQLRGAHAAVTIFTTRLSPSVNRLLSMVIEILFAATLLLIAWQLFQGMESKRSSGQTSFLLQFPVWWAYALSVSAAAVAAILGVYVAVARTLEFFTARTILPDSQGANH